MRFLVRRFIDIYSNIRRHAKASSSWAADAGHPTLKSGLSPSAPCWVRSLL
jgi:hypothetical protein